MSTFLRFSQDFARFPALGSPEPGPGFGGHLGAHPRGNPAVRQVLAEPWLRAPPRASGPRFGAPPRAPGPGFGRPSEGRLSPDFPRFRAQIQVLAGPGRRPPKRQISSKSAPKVLQKCSPYDPLQRALLRGFGGGPSARKNILRPLIRATKMANDRPSRGPFWQKSCKNPHENACFFRNFAKPRFFARALF